MRKASEVSGSAFISGFNGSGKPQIKAAGFQNNLIEMTDPGSFTPLMNPGKINLPFIALKVKSKIAEETDSETAVEIMLQHMMDHVENIFRGRKNLVGEAVEGLLYGFQMQGRIDLLHGLIGEGVLIHPDYPVMKFQKEASAGFWKGITIGEMVVTEFFFLPITMRLQRAFAFPRFSGLLM